MEKRRSELENAMRSLEKAFDRLIIVKGKGMSNAVKLSEKENGGKIIEVERTGKSQLGGLFVLRAALIRFVSYVKATLRG